MRILLNDLIFLLHIVMVVLWNAFLASMSCPKISRFARSRGFIGGCLWSKKVLKTKDLDLGSF